MSVTRMVLFLDSKEHYKLWQRAPDFMVCLLWGWLPSTPAGISICSTCQVFPLQSQRAQALLSSREAPGFVTLELSRKPCKEIDNTRVYPRKLGGLAGSRAVCHGLNMLPRNRELCKILKEKFPVSAPACEILEGCHSPPNSKKLNQVPGLVRGPVAISKVESDLWRHLVSTLSLQMYVHTHACTPESTHTCDTKHVNTHAYTHNHTYTCKKKQTPIFLIY